MSLRTFTLLCLSLLFPAQAGARDARIELIERALAPGERFDLRISDTWPNGCVPELESVQVLGQDIWVLARESVDLQRACTQALRDYSIDTRTLGSAQLRLARSGLQRVHYAVRAGAELRIRAFDLIGMGGSAEPPPTLESGFWWAEPAAEGVPTHAGPGIGLALERQGGIQSAVLYGYDEAGAPEWILGSGGLVDGAWRMNISRLSGGSGPRAPYRRPSDAVALGQLLLEPLGPARARVWLVYSGSAAADLDLRSFTVVRFGFAGSPEQTWRGRWLLLPAADANGQSLARELDFEIVRRDDTGFILEDPVAQARLSCEHPANRAERLPSVCYLQVTGEDTAWEFDQLGLRRLEGHDASGAAVRLLSLVER